MQPYSTKHRGQPKYIADRHKGNPKRARGITKSAKQQIIAANRARHKAERRLAQLRIRRERDLHDDIPVRILVVVAGGVVQAVYADCSVMYAIAKYNKDYSMGVLKVEDSVPAANSELGLNLIYRPVENDLLAESEGFLRRWDELVFKNM